MKQPDNINVDAATNSLLAFCPDDGKREELWNEYVKRKESDGNDITASIRTIGSFAGYLSKVLEFTESATGAF